MVNSSRTSNHQPVPLHPDLNEPLALAGAAAQDMGSPVGSRELLLALAVLEPRTLTNAAEGAGVDPARLACALGEFLPAVANALGRRPGAAGGGAPRIAAEARTALAQASTSATPRAALAAVLFARPGTDGAEPTNAALRALSLI